MKKKKKTSSQSNNHRSRLPWKHRKTANNFGNPDNRLPLTNEAADAYRREMARLIEYANLRVDSAIADNAVSLELDRFLQGDAGKRFDISSISTVGELKAYMSQVDVVVNSLTPLSRKGFIDSALMEAEVYRGQFGSQFRNAYMDDSGNIHYRRFNMAPVFDDNGNIIRRAVSPDLASKAFAAYRKLEQQYAGYIGRQGQEMMFGSENLIILLYDFYEKNPGADNDFIDSHNNDDALMSISPLIREWINEQLLEMEGLNLRESQVSAIISDWDDYLNRRWF